eukprot:Gb_17525 [translate_table: standard]
MDNFTAEYAVGYAGTPLCYLDNDTALGIAGNSICRYSLLGGQNKPILWGTAWGISTFAFNPRTNWIAYAEKRLNPSVLIHDYQTKQLMSKLSDLAYLEISSMAFSTQGTRLITASREPDFRLDLKSKGTSVSLTFPK